MARDIRSGAQIVIIWDAGVPWLAELGERMLVPLRSVTSSTGLHAGLALDGGSIRAVVLLADLKWDGRQRASFHGLEMLSVIRAEYGLRCPIAVCSFSSLDVLRRRAPLLKFVRHHPFIRLPTTPDEVWSALSNADEVDDSRMAHILQYCDARGRLAQLLTHGEGLVLFRRVYAEWCINESTWRALRTDGDMLSRYLLTGVIGPTIKEAGQDFLGVLERSVATMDVELLRRAQVGWRDLIDVLRRNQTT